VAESIEVVMNTLFDPEKNSSFSWPLKVKTDAEDNANEVIFKIQEQEGRWGIDATFIEAALSLWIFHIREDSGVRERQKRDREGMDGDWLRKEKDVGRKQRNIRLLGPDASSKQLRTDIGWWIGDINYEEVKAEGNARDNNATILGFLGVGSENQNFGMSHQVVV
jgi:hypothetical protein